MRTFSKVSGKFCAHRERPEFARSGTKVNNFPLFVDAKLFVGSRHQFVFLGNSGCQGLPAQNPSGALFGQFLKVTNVEPKPSVSNTIFPSGRIYFVKFGEFFRIKTPFINSCCSTRFRPASVLKTFNAQAYFPIAKQVCASSPIHRPLFLRRLECFLAEARPHHRSRFSDPRLQRFATI